MKQSIVFSAITMQKERRNYEKSKANSWVGYSEDDVYLYFDSSLISSRILENNIITIYGTSQGLYTYETVRGNERIVPLIEVDKIDT